MLVWVFYISDFPVGYQFELLIDELERGEFVDDLPSRVFLVPVPPGWLVCLKWVSDGTRWRAVGLFDMLAGV